MRKIRLASDNPYDDNYVDTSTAGLLTVVKTPPCC